MFAQAADVSNRSDVDALAAAALNAFPNLQILVNNAGVYGPMGLIEDVDWEAWLRTLEINLIGSVLMCRALLPGFKKRRHGKIIQLSGGGATNPLPRISSYAASKAAVVRFAESLAEEVREDGIDVNSIAPGPLNTRLLDEVLEGGADRVGSDFYEKSRRQKAEGGVPLDKAARLAVYLGSTASDGISGKLLSAVWDRWERLDEHLEDMRRTDVYTLRRIVPADRALVW